MLFLECWEVKSCNNTTGQFQDTSLTARFLQALWPFIPSPTPGSGNHLSIYGSARPGISGIRITQCIVFCVWLLSEDNVFEMYPFRCTTSSLFTSLPSHVSLHGCTPFSLPFHQLRDFWVLSNFWIL